MPDLRTSLVAHLKANATLAALVSTRVYSWTLPEAAWSGTMPCIVLNRLDVNALKTTGGARDLANTLWQIDVYGATSTSMDAAADAVRNALDGYRGDIGTVASGKVFAQRCHSVGQIDELLPPESGQSDSRYRCIFTFEIDSYIAVPTLA